MNVEVMMCVFGALLVLTGVVGGGLEVKELKIPKVGLRSRVAAYVSGFVFILMGVVLSFVADAPSTEDGQEVADVRSEPETSGEESSAADEETEPVKEEQQQEEL